MGRSKIWYRRSRLQEENVEHVFNVLSPENDGLADSEPHVLRRADRHSAAMRHLGLAEQ